MNKKYLLYIYDTCNSNPFGIYAISPLFTSNTVNEPLPTTAVGVNKNTVLHTYQEFVSINNQDK